MIVPDHNSLWRFWRDNKKTPLRQLFKQSIRLALDAGLVGLVLQAVDGTKIQERQPSAQGGWTKEKMKKLLAALEGELNEAEEQLEKEEPGTGRDGLSVTRKAAEDPAEPARDDPELD